MISTEGFRGTNGISSTPFFLRSFASNIITNLAKTVSGMTGIGLSFATPVLRCLVSNPKSVRWEAKTWDRNHFSIQGTLTNVCGSYVRSMSGDRASMTRVVKFHEKRNENSPQIKSARFKNEPTSMRPLLLNSGREKFRVCLHNPRRPHSSM